MKFNIKASVQLTSTLDPYHIVKILEPENETLDGCIIKTKRNGEFIVTIIEGKMKLGTILHTIDDILHTISISENVAESTNVLTDTRDHQ